MKNGIAEILKKAESLSGDARIDFLKSEYNNKVLIDIIKMSQDKNLIWAVPDGVPPYKANQVPGSQPNLYSGWKRMYIFFPNGGGQMPQLKREGLFIQFLESLDPADAELLCAVKDKKMPYKITKAQFEKAFPGIFDRLTPKA